MIIAVTGHRPNRLGNEYNGVGPYSDYIWIELSKVIRNFRPKKMISGMAQGVDTIFAQVAMSMEIPLIAAVPFRGQASKWPAKAQKSYEIILDHPDTDVRIITEGPYHKGVYHARDRWMVDNCDKLVAVWNGSESGTGYTVKYAQSTKKQIILINPEGWRKNAVHQEGTKRQI